MRGFFSWKIFHLVIFLRVIKNNWFAVDTLIVVRNIISMKFVEKSQHYISQFSFRNIMHKPNTNILKEKEVSSFNTHCSKFRFEKCSWHISMENVHGRKKDFSSKGFTSYNWLFWNKHFGIVLIFKCNLSYNAEIILRQDSIIKNKCLI